MSYNIPTLCVFERLRTTQRHQELEKQLKKGKYRRQALSQLFDISQTK